MPIHTANLQAINALGKSDIFLILEVIKKVIGLIILVISLQFGVYAIALGQVFSGILSTFINAYPNKQLLNYSYKEQLVDIVPSLTITMIMGIVVYMFKFINISVWNMLVIQISVGIFIYFALAKLFKIESFIYLIETFKQLHNMDRKSM